MQEKYRDKGLQVVAVTDETASEVKKDAVFGRGTVTILTQARDAFSAYDVSTIPHNVFFNARGDVVSEGGGLDEIEQQLQ